MPPRTRLATRAFAASRALARVHPPCGRADQFAVDPVERHLRWPEHDRLTPFIDLLLHIDNAPYGRRSYHHMLRHATKPEHRESRARPFLSTLACAPSKMQLLPLTRTR